MSVVLSEHLPLLATAPGGIQKLRGLILELAVRGKLVLQDPNDEPASRLLKQIKLERVRLETEGSCKKSKATPVVEVDEQPFALPHSWVWTRLGEITNFGQTDKEGEIRDTTWVLDLEDIQKDTSVLLRKVRFAERQAKSDKNRFQEGDVLYGKLRPYLNKVIVADEEGVCTTEILPIRGYYGVFPRYLMHGLKRPDFLAYVNSKSYGMKMPRLGTDDGRLALFPLPPLKEQHRIVAKVDELMALCDQLEAEQVDSTSAHARLVETLLGTLTRSTDSADLAANWQRLAEHFDTLFITEASIDALKQVIIDLAVRGALTRTSSEGAGKPLCSPSVLADGKPYLITGSWKWYRMDEVVAFQGGSQPPKNTFIYEPRVGYTRLVQIRDFKSDAHLTYIPNERANRLFSVDDVMIGRYGPPVFQILRGLSGTYNVALMKATPVIPELTKDFLFWLLQESRIHDTVVNESERTAGQTGIRLPLLHSFIVGIPPSDEQQCIVAKINELMALSENLKSNLATARMSQSTLAETLIESALEAA